MSVSRSIRTRKDQSVLTQCLLKHLVLYPRTVRNALVHNLYEHFGAVVSKFNHREVIVALSHLIYSGSVHQFDSNRRNTTSAHCQNGILFVSHYRPPSILHVHSCLVWSDPNSQCEGCAVIVANRSSCTDEFEKSLTQSAELRTRTDTKCDDLVEVFPSQFVLGSRLNVLFEEWLNDSTPSAGTIDITMFDTDPEDNLLCDESFFIEPLKFEALARCAVCDSFLCECVRG